MKGNLRVLFMCMCLSYSGLALSARYEVAASNYQNQKYELAYEQFLALASLGNKDAQYALGLMHVNGYHVEESMEKGYAWIRISATDPNGAFAKSQNILKQRLSPEQLANSEVIFRGLAQTYSDDVINAKLMPKLIKSSSSTYKRRKPMVKVPATYPKNALSRGLIGSATIRFMVAEDGRVKYPTVDKATDKVFIGASIRAAKAFIYKPATIDKAPTTTFDVQNRFIFEMATETKIKHEKLYSALIELREKADVGGSIDRYNYAKSAAVLRNYLEPERRDEFFDSIKYYSKAAVDGLPHAKYELGKSIMYGEQCESDFDRSYFWLSDAAKDGLPEAQMMLGLERLNGVRFDADLEQGLSWLAASAKTYDPAKVELAVALMTKVDSQSRDTERAKALLESIDDGAFEDRVSLYEARALFYLAAGDNKASEKALKRLKKEAKKLKLPFDVLETNIARRLSGEAVLPLKS